MEKSDLEIKQDYLEDALDSLKEKVSTLESRVKRLIALLLANRNLTREEHSVCSSLLGIQSDSDEDEESDEWALCLVEKTRKETGY